jgi:transposase
MSGKRHTEEFKTEAVKQVTDHGYTTSDVAKRLGVTTNNLYDWIRKYGDPGSQHQAITSQQDEI